MNITELPRPSNWANNSQGLFGTPPGNDAEGSYFDNDGQTAWIFQRQAFNGTQFVGTGFARVDLRTNVIIFSGNWNNSVTGSFPNFLYANAGVPMWVQQGSFYYTLEVNLNSSVYTLHKMIVSPSSSSGFGNGYLTDVATIAGATLGFSGSTYNLADWKIVNSGGVNYLLIISRSPIGGGIGLVVVNADTMSFVGGFNFPSTFSGETVTDALYGATFADKNGAIWVVNGVDITGTDTNSLKKGIFLNKWTPSNGASGGNLSGVVTTFINGTTLGLITAAGSAARGIDVTYGTYNTNNHSVILGGQSAVNNSSSGVVVIDLTSFTQVSFHAPDVKEICSNLSDAAFCTFNGIGIQNGQLLSATTTGTLIDSLTFLDPVTLNQLSTLNLTALINASTVTDKVPANKSIISLRYSSLGILINYDGSPVYFVPLSLCGAVPPLGNPFIK